ncbi:hypothetical protein ACROYT_G001543 [Oculina patagonica]
MDPNHFKVQRTTYKLLFAKMSCTIDNVLEETLSDIDEFIQSELGFAPLIVTEPLTAAELHDLSSLLQTRESSNGPLLRCTPGNETIGNVSSPETPNKFLEVEVEVQIVGLKDVYDKKTKKTNNGLEYRLENSEVTVAVRASDEITSVRAYTQRCAEAAIRTHDTIGPVELDVNTLQSDQRCRVVTVDLGSVYKTQEGDPVYWLEKAEVMQRNKWEMIIAMEFSSGLKGSVKSEAFRVTTKASYKMRRNGDVPSCSNVQRLFRKFTWSDYHDVANPSFHLNHGIKQEIPDHADCALSRELMGFSLKEENDCWVTEQQSVENSGLGPSAEKKILFQHHTVLDRHMVTTYYGHNPKIHYVVEQPELPGLLKLVGKRATLVNMRRKANGHKNAEEDFWWACGHCFFERRKKSTIKAHVIQGVCQKSIENKKSRRKLINRHFSQSDLEEKMFEGYSWKSSLSV